MGKRANLRVVSDEAPKRPRVAEFFAGIGLVRVGLEASGFEVAWSNDYSPKKQAMYERHFGRSDDHEFVLGDISDVHGDDLPSDLSVAWASSPCTDVSLAGDREGLDSGESATFWEFTRILDEMGEAGRPAIVALENVEGLATSHGGEDLAAAVRELNRLGYSVDIMALDARRFVPQSRGRLFLVGAQDPPEDEPVPNSELRPDWLQAPYGDPTLRTHRAALPTLPPPLTSGLHAEIERLSTDDARWWDEDRTHRFIESLSEVQASRLGRLREADDLSWRTAYRRTRNKVAVWEIRPDDISGCLRTARGGSSKQAVVEAGNGEVRVRWMTPVEYARLMGAPNYNLDAVRANDAYFGFGDAVCVPAVLWLAENYLLPLSTRSQSADMPRAIGLG